MTLDPGTKVRPCHLQRTAFLYVRQSTVRQVLQNTESTRRQYALKQLAVSLGWQEDQVVVVDDDLGRSGASATGREGFQRLVTEVGLGHAGIVLGLEVSRLARNSIDWHRLLEICAVTDTLILDEDGIYDPAHFNDRLLLGLKGTMSEAELHVIHARLQGGIINKARRGELRTPLPIGFVYADDGRVVFDPDDQVQESVRSFFETFRRVGSARGAILTFREQGLRFPRRQRRGPHKGDVTFEPLTASLAYSILHNPRYAGTYAYGRKRWRRLPGGGSTVSRRPREEWIAFIPDAHPGYITWTEYEANLERLHENDLRAGLSESRRSPPREGPALLQGLVVCGRCGRRMRTRYRTRRGLLPDYCCNRASSERGEPICQTMPGASIDAAVSRLMLDVVTPMALQVALDVQQDIQDRIEEADRLRRQQVTRAQYAVDLARRRYMNVDPDNRLVAGSLEVDWNDNLIELEKAREEVERQRQADRLVIDQEGKRRVEQLATDFPRLWEDPATPARERKRMLALLIEDVTLIKGEELITAHVRFKGGRCETLSIPRPKAASEAFRTSPQVITEIDRLMDNHAYGEIANILNERGFRSGHDQVFTGEIVSTLRYKYKLSTRDDRLREQGMLTRQVMAVRLGISNTTLKAWRKLGIVTGHWSGREYLYDDPGKSPPKKMQGRKRTPVINGSSDTSVATSPGGAV